MLARFIRPGRQSGLLSFQQTQLSEKDERFDYLLISSSALDTFVQIHFKTTKLSLVGLLGNLCEIAFVHVSRRWENEISYTKLGLYFIFSREKNRTIPILTTNLSK